MTGIEPAFSAWEVDSPCPGWRLGRFKLTEPGPTRCSRRPRRSRTSCAHRQGGWQTRIIDSELRLLVAIRRTAAELVGRSRPLVRRASCWTNAVNSPDLPPRAAAWLARPPPRLPGRGGLGNHRCGIAATAGRCAPQRRVGGFPGGDFAANPGYGGAAAGAPSHIPTPQHMVCGDPGWSAPIGDLGANPLIAAIPGLSAPAPELPRPDQ